MNRPRTLSLWLVTLGAVGVLACSNKVENMSEGMESPATGYDGGLKAAEVDGRPVWLHEVRDLARKSGKEPREVLDRLIGESLLASQARRQGLGRTADVAETRTRALAYRLIEKQVLEPHSPERIPESELRAAYDKDPTYVQHRSRSVTHILVSFKGKDLTTTQKEAQWNRAEALARRITADARSIADEAAFKKLVEVHQPTADAQGLTIRSETIPGIAVGDSRLLRGFVDRAYEIPSVGKIGEPLRTMYGWHVIFLTQETPEATLHPFSEVRDAIANRIATQQRSEALNRLLDRLEKDYPFSIDDALLLGTEARDAGK